MRLSEFDYKHHRNLVDQLMTKNGYKKLGQGYESVVYEKDAGNAIKIIIPESGEQAGGNQAHDAFLEFCRAHKDNPHLPRFAESQTPLVIDGEEFKQIVMEKLNPITDPIIIEVLGIMAGDAANTSAYAMYRDWNRVLAELHEYVENDWLSDKVAKLPWPSDKVLTNTFSKLFTTAKTLMNYSQYQWDLHAGNVMQRADGTLVIIDPWVG